MSKPERYDPRSIIFRLFAYWSWLCTPHTLIVYTLV